MNDQAIEQQIQAKGKTAPRVTPADIEENIASAHYFTAADGVRGEGGDTRKASAMGAPASLELLTFCVLTLRNGFTVTGESACASPENFDAEIGRNIARQNAVQKIWPLMGYQLRDELHRRAQFAAEPKVGGQLVANGRNPHYQGQFEGETAEEAQARRVAAVAYSKLQPHQQRVVDEKAELDEKRAKLIAFFGTPIFAALSTDEKERLEAQEHFMAGYSNVLADRIARF